MKKTPALTLEYLLAPESTLKMELGPILKALGEDTPEIVPNDVGRFRLVRALRRKYGASYRSIPLAKHAIEHFDTEVKFIRAYREAKRGVKHGKS